jgi:hypothetical protein
MGKRTIDLNRVFERGVENPDALDSHELAVFAILQLEILADMEGWDHFFTTTTLRFYSALKAALVEAEDFRSLQVLESYEAYLRFRSVPFTPEHIEAFVSSLSDQGLATDPDWHESFSAASGDRWLKIERWLATHGRELVV